jgi:phosphoglycolate phosphatase-like HAD superfamily hydrolase
VSPPSLPFAAVDLDGVVADVRHRLHLVTGRRKDWDAFFAAAPHDPPLPEGVAVVDRLLQDHEVVWLTGRPERCRTDTLRWLAAHSLPDGRLVMRREGDRRPARVTKVELLRRLAAERRVDVLIDDDAQVVRAARSAGFEVLHATWMSEDRKERLALVHAQEVDART